MNEIKCPNCGTVFKIDEKQYDSIVKQVRDSEFKNEIATRQEQYEKDKNQAIKLAENELEKKLSTMLKEKDLEDALNLITNADCLIVCGTSLKVYPAAGLVRYYQHDKLVVINKDSTDYDQYADLVINDSLSNVLSQIKL